jgi:hypothetical protein
MARSLIDVWREGGDLWLAVVFHPKDRATGAVRALLFTDAPALYTSPADTPPNARFVTRLLPSWRLKRAVAPSGSLTGPSSIESAGFDIDNSDGSLTFLKSLIWSDQPFEVYMGSPRGPAGQAIGFSSFLRVFSGVTQNCQGATTLSIAALGRKASLDNPLVQNYYRGFGMGVSLVANSSTGLVGVASEEHNVTGSLSIEWVGRLTGTHFGTSWAPLFQVSNFYGLIVGADGKLGFITGASATDLSSVRFSSYGPPANVDLYLAGVVAPDGVTVSLYSRVGMASATTGFRPGALQLAGTLTMPVPVNKTDPDAGIPAVGLRTGAAHAVGQHVYEIRVRAESLDYETLSAGSERPLPLRGEGVSNLLDAWRFGEGTGTDALSEVNHVTLALTGDAKWLPSLDGDDPAVFPGGPLGQTKPTCWGPCFQLPLVLLDKQTQTYGWRGPDLDVGVGPSFDLWGRLRANGAPLVPDETIALGAGSITFGFDDPHVIALSGIDAVTGVQMTGKRLIPGQLSPARPGQRIVVTGTTSSNGTYTLAPDGLGGQPTISNNGRDIRVVESMTGETVLSPTPAVIRTLAADRQFSYNLANSTAIILASDQAGAFGIDVTGGSQATYLASELFAIVADGPINTDGLLWDPPLAVGHLLNAATTRKGLLDAIALSAMAWWVEDETGVFRLVTIRPPVGSPSRRFRSEILSIRSISSTVPFARITVAHSRAYLVVDQGNIPGSVPANDRARLSTEYLLAPRTASAETLDNFPQSKPRPEAFQTYLIDAPNAERWLDFAAPMVLEERLWWEVTMQGAWIASAVKSGDEHEFIYAPPTGTFENGAAARVMSVSVEKSSDRTVLEVLT